jgi:outer membrane autotransporter protein
VVGLVAGNSNNTTFNNIAGQISDLVQSGNSADAKKGLEGALSLAPSVAPVVNSNAQEGVKQLFNAIGQRLSGSTGRAGGFEFNDAGVWAQGLYNKAELRTANGFDGRSAGIAVGIDGKISDDAMLGFGLAYTNSKIDSANRRTTSDNYSLSIYSEKTFEEDLFVNGILSYGFANYDESKNVLGFNVGADYNVNSLAAQITGGHHFKNSATDSVFTPEIGARYLLIAQESYSDGAGQKISSDTSSTLTGVAGLRFKTGEFSDGKGLRMIPELKVAGTWDAVSADNTATVVLPNNSSYKIDGEELERLGLEAGFKIGLEVKNVVVSLAYEGRFKQNYSDHTGLLNVRYNF